MEIDPNIFDPKLRLDLEWLVISALRENLSLIQETEYASYNQAIRFAQENFTELFGTGDSPFGKRSTRSQEYIRYEQEAHAKTVKEHNKYTAEDLIRQRLNIIDGLLQWPDNRKTNFSKLKNERKRLRQLLREEVPRFTKVDENQALIADFKCDRPGLAYDKNVAGKYNVYKTKTDQQFVLRFLHPGVAESATGADVVYEIFDSKRNRIRIIAIQYKMWEKGTLYFSQHENIEYQIEQGCECFCNTGMCNAPNSNKLNFRLPFCVPFLRPTDRIYDTHNLISTGWHIPICQVNDHLDYSYANGKILRLNNIKGIALNTQEFENMFQQEMIGSRWLELDEVEDFYRNNNILSPSESIIIFSQKRV